MSKPNEKVLQKLDYAILMGLSTSAMKRPGVVIACMSQADRDILKELTSSDTEQQRPIYLEV